MESQTDSACTKPILPLAYQISQILKRSTHSKSQIPTTDAQTDKNKSTESITASCIITKTNTTVSVLLLNTDYKQ